MKKQIKNYTTLIFCLSLLIFINSCSGTFSVDISSPDSTTQLREKIGKEINDDDMVVEIRLASASETFSSDMKMATVNYYEAGKKEPLAKIVDLGGGDPRTSRPDPYAFDQDDDTNTIRATGVKFSDIDFSKIHTNIAKAIAIMESDEVGMPYSGIGDYTIKVPYPDKISHTFTLQSSGGTSTKTGNRGLTLETKYYEIKFEADKDGNVTLKKK